VRCTCQYLVLLAYPPALGRLLVMVIHSDSCDTFLSLLDREETEWLGALLPLVAPAAVKSVTADVASQEVTVEWEAPAAWDTIQATLVEINYPPAGQ